MDDLIPLPEQSLMRSFRHQSHLQHLSIIGILAMAYQARFLMRPPDEPLSQDILVAGWPPPYMSQLMQEFDVEWEEVTQYARYGNDFWGAQLTVMPLPQRILVMGLASVVLLPSTTQLNPNRYTPWMGYWAKALEVDSLTMVQWLQTNGSKLMQFLLVRGFAPSDF